MKMFVGDSVNCPQYRSRRDSMIPIAIAIEFIIVLTEDLQSIRNSRVSLTARCP